MWTYTAYLKKKKKIGNINWDNVLCLLKFPVYKY